MKKRSRLEQLGDFVLGKGFYIVLLLCVATIGVSGYALVHNFTAKPAASSPAGGSAAMRAPRSRPSRRARAAATMSRTAI